MQVACARCARWATRLGSSSRVDSYAYIHDARQHSVSSSSSTRSYAVAGPSKSPQLYVTKERKDRSSNDVTKPALKPRKTKLEPKKKVYSNPDTTSAARSRTKPAPKDEGYIQPNDKQSIEGTRFDFDQPNPRKPPREPIPIMEGKTLHEDAAMGIAELLAKNPQVNTGTDPKMLFGILAGWLLRHHARNLGYGIAPDGFVRVSDVLRFPPFSSYSVSQLARLAETDEKDRFEVAHLPDYVEGVIKDVWWIRARHMHTIPGVNPTTKRVIRPEKLHIVEYRTELTNWDYIRSKGIPEDEFKLIRLYKPAKDLFIDHIPSSQKILSITIDCQKARDLGVMFYHTNDVRLFAVGAQSTSTIPLAACRSAIIMDVMTEKLK